MNFHLFFSFSFYVSEVGTSEKKGKIDSQNGLSLSLFLCSDICMMNARIEKNRTCFLRRNEDVAENIKTLSSPFYY
jgi:hypothetical protein